MEALASALRAGGEPAARRAREPAAADAIASALAAALSDAHHRVARAALEACAELVALAPVAFERNLESLCPALFPKLVDAKESIRAQASAALAAVGDAFSPDALLPALLESLEQSKAPRAKTGVLEFALYVLSGQGGGADPEGAPHRPAKAGSLNLRRWVARVAPLLTSEKAHGPLRAAAAAGLAAVHARADRAVVVRHIAGIADQAEAQAAARAVARHAPGIEAEVRAFAAAERRAGERREEELAARRDERRRGEREERVTERGARESARESDPSDSDSDASSVAGHAGGAKEPRDERSEAREAKGSGGSSDPPAPLPSLAPATPPPPSAPPRETRLPPGNPERSSRSEDAPHAPHAPYAPHASPPLPAHPATFALREALDGLDARPPGSGAPNPRALAAVRRALRGGAAVAPDDGVAARVAKMATETLAATDPPASAETKTHALFALRDLARCAPEAFVPLASFAVPRIVDEMEANKEGADGGDPDVALGAADALEGVVDAMAPETALAALATRLGDGGAATVRCLCGVARRIDAEALTRGTPALVPGLVRAFNSQSADVRKAVVDAIVAMYDQLGDWLLPQFAGLTAAQQKLVTIYINRATEAGGAKKGGRRGGGGGAGSAGGGDQGARVPLAPRQMQ